MPRRPLRRRARESERRRLLSASARTFVAAIACVVAYYALPYGRHHAAPGGTGGLLIFAGGCAVVLVLIIRQVRTHMIYGGRDTDIETLLLALCLLLITFSLIYLRLADQFADLQTKTDALYFTMATVATVGYGDVHPVGQGARALVTLQMAIDLVFVGALATVATGLIRQRAERRRAEVSSDSAG